MRLSSALRLYRVRLRARVAQELFAVLGIAIGVSLLFSSQVANTSLNGSVRELTRGVVGQAPARLERQTGVARSRAARRRCRPAGANSDRAGAAAHRPATDEHARTADEHL